MLKHEFVEFIPKDLADGVLYISIPYATASHKCCCGCDKEVVTPITPTDWRLIFNGVTVSLEPSIGNWGFPCQSHYWITENRVEWAPKWQKSRIEQGRAADKFAKAKYYESSKEVYQEKEKAEPNKKQWITKIRSLIKRDSKK